MSEYLGTALPAEMARVRDEVMPTYMACLPNAALAVINMRDDLDAAAKVMADGDTVAMLRAYEALKGYHE